MKAKFPNESLEYREARNKLLQAEVELRANIEKVAGMRRALPLGGEVTKDYEFYDLDEQRHKLDGLFENHDTLLLYSYMFGPTMSEPCSMCTSILDGLISSLPSIKNRCSIAIVISGSVDQAKPIYQNKKWENLPIYSCQRSEYNRDYLGELADGTQIPMMNVFQRKHDKYYHFWGSELVFEPAVGDPRHMDLVWPLWNVLDLTPQGRGDAYPDLDGMFS